VKPATLVAAREDLRNSRRFMVSGPRFVGRKNGGGETRSSRNQFPSGGQSGLDGVSPHPVHGERTPPKTGRELGAMNRGAGCRVGQASSLSAPNRQDACATFSGSWVAFPSHSSRRSNR